MSNAETLPAAAPAPSTAWLVLRYVAILVGGGILLNLTFWGLETYFNIRPGNAGASGLILIWAAAFGLGSSWYGRERGRPPAGRAWRIAFFCAAVTYLLQGVLIGLIYAGAGLPAMSGRDQMVILAIFGMVAVLEFLIIRLGIGMGAKQALKRAQLQAERTGG